MPFPTVLPPRHSSELMDKTTAIWYSNFYRNNYFRSVWNDRKSISIRLVAHYCEVVSQLRGSWRESLNRPVERKFQQTVVSCSEVWGYDVGENFYCCLLLLLTWRSVIKVSTHLTLRLPISLSHVLVRNMWCYVKRVDQLSE